jgi:hypothetical protein
MLDWDQSHDWVLERFRNDRTRVTIRFRQTPPSVAELAAVRRCLAQFRDTAPAAVRAAVGESGELPLGALPSPEARQVIQAAEAEGLRVVAEGASFVSYLPFDRTTGCAWLIEDDAEAAAVAQAMLAAGVPVRDVEA